MYIRIPFATAGDRTAIDVTGAASGPVNYQYGFGTDYSLPRSTDPAALNIERVKFNELMYDLSSCIQQYQQFGVPVFISTSDNGGTAFQYSKNAITRYDNGTTIENYLSLVDSNDQLPTVTANWLKLQNDPAYLSKANTFSAVQTIGVNGTPLVVNSLDSTIQKISLKDNGTQRGMIGASSSMAFAVYLGNGITTVGGWNTSGNLVPSVTNTFDIGGSGLIFRDIYTGTLKPSSSSPSGNSIYLPSSNVMGISSAGALGFAVANPSPSTVNYLQAAGAITGNAVFLSALGADTNVALVHQVKGAASHFFLTGAGYQMVINDSGGTTVNAVNITGSATGGPCIISAQGSDAALGMLFYTTGTGNIEFKNQNTTNPLLILQNSGIVKFSNTASMTANGTAAVSVTALGPAGITTATIKKWLTIQDSSGTTLYIPAWGA